MDNGKVRELSIALLFGCLVAVSIAVATGLDTKWMVFILFANVALATVFIIPRKELFFLYTLFFLVPIALDFFLVYVPPLVYRPVNGLAIRLTDIPIFFLLLFWAFRLVADSRERIDFYWWVTGPFFIIIAAAILGAGRSQVPGIIKFSCLLLMAECWLVFLYVANNVRSRKVLLTILVVIFATVLLQAMLGFAQKATGGHLGLKLFGESTESFREMRAGFGTVSRVGGTFGSANKLAGYLGMFIPVMFSLLFAPIRRHYRMLLFGTLVIALVLEVITFSRGGWVGLGIGGVCTLYWLVLRRVRNRVASIILTMTFVAVLAGAIVIGVEPVRRRLFQEDFGAAYTRWPMMVVAANMIHHNPLLGVGISSYTTSAPNYDISTEAVTYWFPWPVHNEIMLTSAELGLPAGVMLLVILIVSWVWLFRVGRSRDDPLLALTAIGLFGGLLAWFVHYQFEFANLFQQPAVWAYFGLYAAIYRLAGTDEQPTVATELT